MTNASNADIRHFLEQFFGTDNKFDLGKIERGEGKQAKIRPWVELLNQRRTSANNSSLLAFRECRLVRHRPFGTPITPFK